MPRTLIIAEAGVNHNGSLEMAEALVDAAADAGADIVKFQTFKAARLASRQAPKAAYQVATTGLEGQLEMLRRLELDEAAHRVLQSRCRARGIQFLSTPFDEESVAFLAHDLGLPRLKVSSGEIVNAPLLLRVASTGLPVLLSTGMSTLGDVEAALGVLAFGYLGGHESPSREGFLEAYASGEGRRLLREKVALLHCTTEYPAPAGEINLRAMDTLRLAFGLEVGYSDHSAGIAIALAAVARGATILEKHFTLDRTLPGPDHAASLEPHELTQMVRGIREVETALGDGIKAPTPSEAKNLEAARKSLVALRDVRRGELLSAENMGIKRPGTGVSPMEYWNWLGRPSPRDYAADTVIRP